MSTIGNTVVTLTDWAKRVDPDGKGVAQVVELLSQENEILQDIPFMEGNLPTGHRTTVRTGLPDVYYRLLNAGVPSSKSTTAQVDEACGMLEGYSKVDKDLAMLNGFTAAFRLSEDRPFLEAMSQKFASKLFYGNTATDPEEFLGFAPRFNDIGGGAPANADNIISASGSADNTSIWLIGWGEKSCHGIYPKGSQAGLMMKDLGEDTASDGSGGEYQILRTHFQWKHGLVVKDWRYVVRIANIDTTDLTKDAGSGADLIDLMTQAEERLHSAMGVRPIWYANRTIRSFLRRQIVNKVKNSTLRYEDVAGRKVMMFGDYPFHLCDSITNSEATVA